MTGKQRIETIKGFERYQDFINNHGADETIERIREENNSLIFSMKGHMGEAYELKAYISADEEVHIENMVDGASVFEYGSFLEDYGITERELHFIKFGRED